MRTEMIFRLVMTAALVLATAGRPTPGTAQAAAVDSAQLFRHLEALSADSMEGRLAGTPGSAKARAYILDRFKAAKLTPADGKSFERPFTFRGARGAADRTGVNLLGM